METVGREHYNFELRYLVQDVSMAYDSYCRRLLVQKAYNSIQYLLGGDRGYIGRYINTQTLCSVSGFLDHSVSTLHNFFSKSAFEFSPLALSFFSNNSQTTFSFHVHDKRCQSPKSNNGIKTWCTICTCLLNKLSWLVPKHKNLDLGS